jgi:hypothetical protein
MNVRFIAYVAVIRECEVFFLLYLTVNLMPPPQLYANKPFYLLRKHVIKPSLTYFISLYLSAFSNMLALDPAPASSPFS